MNYTSNEEFSWKRHSDTGPIMRLPSHQPTQEEVRTTSKEDTDASSPASPSHTYQQNRITTPLEDMTMNRLISGLFRPNAEKRLEAVRAIKAAGKEVCLEAIPGLQMALRDDSSDAVRVAAAEALGILGEYAPVEALKCALSDDPFWDVRAAAAQSLGKLGRRTPIRHLIAMLEQESDESVRSAIVRALGRQGKAMPIHMLIGVLYNHNENWLVREAAAWALGRLDRDVPVKPLIYALRNDRDESVRAAAAGSLGLSGSPEAEEPLFETFEDGDEDEEVHEAASWALQHLDMELYELKRQEETYLLDEADARLLRELFPGNSSVWNRQLQMEQAFLALTQFISDKRGCVREKNILNTEIGLVLRVDCFYQNTGNIIEETIFRSIKDSGLLEPIEAALKGRDGIVQEVVKQALETREERQWLDLLVVSFALLCPSRDGQRTPLRVIVTGMGCRRVRENDTSVLDQIGHVWTDSVEEPLAYESTCELADLKIWYHQTPSSHSTQGVAIA